MPEQDFDGMGDDQEKTMYHMGFAYMNRLNILLYRCNDAATNDLIQIWFKELKNLYKELEAKMNDKEREEQEKNLLAGKEKFKIYLEMENQYRMTTANPRNRMLPFYVPDEVTSFMMKWEMSLRRIINRIGMLMPSAEDPRFAMLG